MEQYVDPINHVLYISETRDELIAYVASEMTKDLKRELKLRDDKITALQKTIDNQGVTITCYQTRTEVLYGKNVVLEMKNDVLVDEKKELEKQNVYFSNELSKVRGENTIIECCLETLRKESDFIAGKHNKLYHENEDLKKENESLTKKNAQLTLYNENQAKTIGAMMCCGQYNISPIGVYNINQCYRTP